MKTLIQILLALVVRPAQQFANEAKEAAASLFLANQFTPDKENWVQLSPFGDFANVDKNKKRVIQRFRKEDAEAICNEFNGVGRKVLQPLGMPFYVGHPDHPRFKGQPGHSDTAAKGRGKSMEVRHDPSCQACSDFPNSGQPCGDHGLFVQMKWNPDGEHLIANEAFHGHSVNWSALPDGKENGVQIFRPIRVKSAGFTNEPAIPVTPASLANEEAETEENPTKENMTIPPKLKLIAGFKADDEVTMEQILEALEKAHPLANEAADAALAAANAEIAEVRASLASVQGIAETALANETAAKTARDNERRTAATFAVDGLVKSGHILTADREAKIEALVNAEDFIATAGEFANVAPVIKTKPLTTGLGTKNPSFVEGSRERTAAFEALMAKREQEFPNEAYGDRFAAVAKSPEGEQLIAQMKRPGDEE